MYVLTAFLKILFKCQDFEVVDNEDSAEWEKEIEDMLEEEDNS